MYFGVSLRRTTKTRRRDSTKTRAPEVKKMSRQALLLCQVQDLGSEGLQLHSGRANTCVKVVGQNKGGVPRGWAQILSCFISVAGLTEESPRDEPGGSLPQPPPEGHTGDEPLIPGREVLEEHSRVQNKIPAGRKANKCHEESKNRPARRRPSHDSRHRRHEQRRVEGDLPPDHVGAEAPEEGAGEQARVEGHGGRRRVAAVAPNLGVGLPRRDAREDGDERVDGVAEAAQAEELGVEGRPADLVDGLCAGGNESASTRKQARFSVSS